MKEVYQSRPRWMLLVTLALVLAHPCVRADDEPAATPYRPTVATPAELPVPGWLEVEAGGLRSRSGDVRRDSLPVSVKYAFDEEWGVVLGGEARVRAADASGTLAGAGDTSLTLKHRIASARPELNFGLQAAVKAPTARTGLGSGKADWSLTGIVSADFAEDWRLDFNAGATRLGARTPGQGANVALEAAALSHRVGRWTFAGELSGTQQSGLPGSRQWLVATSYAVTPRVVVDLAFARMQQGDAQQHLVAFGFTWLTGKMF